MTEKNVKDDRPQRDQLTDIALKELRLLRTEDETPYFLRPANVSTVEPIRSSALSRWIMGRYRAERGELPARNAVEEAVRAIEFEALEHGTIVTVSRRYAHHDGFVYVDLGGDEFVKIGPNSVAIVKEAPVYFVRPKGMKVLPRPDIVNGSIDPLFRVLGIEDKTVRTLMSAAVLGMMLPQVHAAALCLEGSHGCGKTTAAKAIKRLVDPDAFELRVFPTKEQDLAVMCKQRWLLAFDNISALPPWAQDALCRVVTGGTFVTRELYTSGEESALSMHNPVLLNGIDDIATRPDLADRCIVLSMPPIPADRRRREEEIWEDFRTATPVIIGGFYNAIAHGLANRGSVSLISSPRMADFAHFIVAAEEKLGIPPGEFIRCYMAADTAARAANFESFPAMELLAEMVNSMYDKKISDSASAILAVMNDEAVRRSRTDLQRNRAWPKLPQELSNQIKRAKPLLESRGISVSYSRTAHERTWTLEATPIATQSPVVREFDLFSDGEAPDDTP